MRTIRFYFKLKGRAHSHRQAMEELIEKLSAPSTVELNLFLLPPDREGGDPGGIGLSGEYELVSITSERLRKHLRARHIPYREEEAAPRPGPAALPPPRLPAEDEVEPPDETEEVVERSDRVAYGEYPQMPGSSRPHPASSRKTPPDLRTRQVLDSLQRDEDFGFSRPVRRLTADERKLLAIHRALKSGISFYRLGLYRDAERQLLETVRLQKANPEAYHYLGLVYDQLGDSAHAARYFKQAIRHDPDTGATHFYLANVYQKQGRFDRAIEEYKRAIELDPDVPIVYNNLAWVFYQTGDHERAIRAFEETIAMEPDLPFAHNGLGCVYQDLGSLQEAVAEFRKSLELYPEYAAAHLKLGWCLLQMGEVAPAVDEFRAVLETSEDPEYTSSANYSLGHSLLAQGQLVPAREAFQQVVDDEDEEFVDALFHLGVIQLRLGFADEAVRLLRRYLRRSPEENRTEVYKYLAQAYFQQEKYPLATRYCRKALELSPDDAEVYELLGQVAGYQMRWETAMRYLHRAIELAPASSTPYLHLGWVHENRNEMPKAIDAYKNAIQRNPEASDAYNSLAWLYLEQGKREEALVIFEKALELNPGDIGLINNLGWLYSDQGKYDEALQYYLKGLEVEPNSPLLRSNVGTLYFHMNRLEDAERELRHALFLERDPVATANAHYYLGLLAHQQGRSKEAVDHLQQALQTDPQMAPAHFRLGECWLALGSPAKARNAFERYLDLDPAGEFAAQARQRLSEQPRKPSRTRAVLAEARPARDPRPVPHPPKTGPRAASPARGVHRGP